jgi:poly-gamma-glutamate biosynthesis protein PgsC/CapC
MIYETLLIGILLAVLYAEIFDITPGGVIVPAYMALYLDQPLRILVTTAVAFLVLLVYSGLSRFLILFGRRRFLMLVLLGIVLGQMTSLVLPALFPVALGVQSIGWIIPGLLANNLLRQKWLPTLSSMVAVSVLAYFVVRIWAWIF